MKTGKPSKRTVVIATTTMLFIAVTFGFYQGIKAVSRFFEVNTLVFNQPVIIKLSKPVEIITRAEQQKRKDNEQLAESLATKAINDYLEPQNAVLAVVQSSISFSSFFDTIWLQESTRGKDKTVGSLHMKCRAKGLWNEIGYNPQAGYCFQDRDHAEAKIKLWLMENCSNKSMAQCLCYYNQGSNNTECAYSKGDLVNAN